MPIGSRATSQSLSLHRREREDAVEAIDARLSLRFEQVHDHLAVRPGVQDVTGRRELA
jgi:hypothetical protein